MVWMRRRTLAVRLIAGLTAAACAGILQAVVASADDALVLPKGRFRATVDDYIYFPIDERWNPDGKPESLASQFEGRRLDSAVFPLLAPLNALVGGNASIGDSDVSFEYHFNILDLGLQYGLTDRLSVGVRVPYYWAHNRVKAAVSSGPGSSANVGANTGAVVPLTPGTAVLPLTTPGVRPFTTEDVQQLLGPGLTLAPGVQIPGFGLKRVRSWSGDGVGDIEAGAKYQFVRTEDWRLAATAGVRFPTGREDDPDDLADIPFGQGAYAMLVRLNADYMLSNLWKTGDRRGTPEVPRRGDVLLDGAFRFDWIFEQNTLRRIPSDPNNPITTNKETVRLDIGDRFEFEASARYYLLQSVSVFGLYKYAFKLEDEVSGNRNLAYRTLEEDTDAREHVYIVGLQYSTLGRYLERKFFLPLNVSVSYRDRFAGAGPRTATGQLLKSRYISVGLQILF